MKTERQHPLTAIGGGGPIPERVQKLDIEIAGARDRIFCALGVFRTALGAFAADWMRAHAKRVAVAQNAHTLSLGRGEIARLKQRLEDHFDGALVVAIAKEFVPERYGDAGPVSSGQVAAILGPRFEKGVRAVLATVHPILEKFGYAPPPPDAGTPPADGDGRYRESLELPPEIGDPIGKIVEAVADIKVAEAKLKCVERQKEKDLAAELWENA